MIDLSKHIHFVGPEWVAIKRWLEQRIESKISLLISDKDIDETNRLRGAIGAFKELLAVEKDAHRASQIENDNG